MERQLVKFVGRVKSGSGISAEISSEYNIIRAQTADMKQSNGFTREAGGLKDNIKKNRYKDILPYDQTRVLLEPLENEFESDYINASFIQGARGNKRYIATQGPLSQTLGDFWRMVWQNDVKVIVMVCREVEMGKRKCECYWATPTDTSTFGSFVISNLEEFSPCEEVVVRILEVKYQDESRTIKQFQYTAWPDHDIPYTSEGILGMINMVRNVQGMDTAPILIHCSAGCGRTGVLCAVDYVHDLLLTQRISEDFNIMEIVTVIRKQRPSAVQTKDQYEFVYNTVAQMFQEYLLKMCNSNQSLAECAQQKHLSSYGNVEFLSGPQHPAPSRRVSSVQPKSKLSLQTQRSHPGDQKMNDTYASVNKPKRSATDPAPRASSPLPAIHHYDNAGLGTLGCSANALYSTVKPKGLGAGVPPQSAVATYDRVIPNHRGPSSAPDLGDYETLPGVSSTSSRNAKVDDTHQVRKKSGDFDSTDDDYEYISNPIIGSAGYCSPRGMGFNCRIRKPKGPRDPPAEWGRMER
ncbi:hypothetical protein COCON_G00141650 [Conger conger]|uniref:protein-tyrosine-phosphatase n=1 Tax=Conger conger TaxID=82655 RepID=A0A9Q1DAY6_CONCO|nr:hypothetical protein COCON_G00141650 [Conger conger]